ncbi:MAG: DNA polymerase III subunit gamma/tau [Acidimicrobiaceae bacterium]|nr:DNA polymerase III subunit gamma/tau [Acidimicrobiaceae bacterium]
MAEAAEPEPYQSLYRRYRPQRFDEVRGQEHVTRALRNAVREGRVSHAYLFSGPRGTGKTSTARILAMALNCEHPDDGEPDGTCPSCVEIRRGASVDVHELDAASNRRLEEMRDLLGRVSLGARGRWKVYIVDEVHQLTPDAASALLKTLEEPPGHVVFVLATTDPQRVLPTIRSRTQHFEFRLLPADVLGALLKDVNDAAGLGVPTEAIDLVVRRGHGSARDALSVLDQVSAAGAVDDEAAVVDEVVDALAERDAGRVLLAVAEAVSAGRDPRRLASDVLAQLRNGFLATQARSLLLLSDDAAARVEDQANRLGLSRLVKAMEVVGQAAADMRDAVDPRVTLEVALVRLAAPTLDDDRAALLERIERIERALSGTAVMPAPSTAVLPPPLTTPSPAPGSPPQPPSDPLTPRMDDPGPRRALGAHRPPPRQPPQDPPAPAAPAPAAPPPASGPLPSRDELTTAWGDHIVPILRPAVKVYLLPGRFVEVDGSAATFALPDRGRLARAEEVRAEAEQALAAHFGRHVPLRLVLDGQTGPPRAEEPRAEHWEELESAAPAVMSPAQRLLQAFPGAEEVEL